MDWRDMDMGEMDYYTRGIDFGELISKVGEMM